MTTTTNAINRNCYILQYELCIRYTKQSKYKQQIELDVERMYKRKATREGHIAKYVRYIKFQNVCSQWSEGTRRRRCIYYSGDADGAPYE